MPEGEAQPMLRLVGLWQQFQQANMSVLRVLLGLQPLTATAYPLRVQPPALIFER